MDLRKKTNMISLLVLVFCIVLAAVIYIFTGIIFIAIIFAPPIVHWILKRREENQQDSRRY
jgi:ABC-type Fe3+-siderophore transport system permease subunit